MTFLSSARVVPVSGGCGGWIDDGAESLYREALDLAHGLERVGSRVPGPETVNRNLGQLFVFLGDRRGHVRAGALRALRKLVLSKNVSDAVKRDVTRRLIEAMASPDRVLRRAALRTAESILREDTIHPTATWGIHRDLEHAVSTYFIW